MGVEERWDSAGMRKLKELYEPLRRFAAVIGRWDVDPDDLVQDAYTKVLMKHSSQIHDLGPYLRRTIVNLATDERLASAAAPTRCAPIGHNDGPGL